MKRRVAPKKSYSQNFLTDGRTAGRIASQLEAGPNDAVIEIGPGTGALTEHLLQGEAAKIVAVELDPRSVEALTDLVDSHHPRLAVLEGSILDIHPEGVIGDTDKEHRLVIGNIPYNITSEILFWIFQHRSSIKRAVIMMQREVARRCVAVPGSKDYGILSVATWYASSAQLAMIVQPGSFFPRPKVTSAVVRFDLRSEPPTSAPFEPFMAFTRAAFGQRRKVLTNALKTWAAAHQVDLTHPTGEGIDLSKTRAEQLSPVQLANIFVELEAQRGKE